MTDEQREMLYVVEKWRAIGVQIYEGTYLPPKTMVVSKDLIDHFKMLAELDHPKKEDV